MDDIYREQRVIPFTKRDNFDEKVDELLTRIKVLIEIHKGRYKSDFRDIGLPGLAVECLRKSGRLQSMVICNADGKDKPEDEFEDNLMSALYATLYHKYLVNGEGI